MVRSKRNQNKIKSIILILSVFVILFCVILIVNTYDSKPYKEYLFDVEFMVNDSIGFDVNSSVLKFGRVVPGSTSTRTIIIDNSYDFPLYATILASDDISELITANNNIVIKSNSNATLDVTLSVPSDYKFGFYTGKVKIELRR